MSMRTVFRGMRGKIVYQFIHSVPDLRGYANAWREYEAWKRILDALCHGDQRLYETAHREMTRRMGV